MLSIVRPDHSCEIPVAIIESQRAGVGAGQFHERAAAAVRQVQTLADIAAVFKRRRDGCRCFRRHGATDSNVVRRRFVKWHIDGQSVVDLLQKIAQFPARNSALVDALEVVSGKRAIPKREVIQLAAEYRAVCAVALLPENERVASVHVEVGQRCGILRAERPVALALIAVERAIAADHRVERPFARSLTGKLHVTGS